MFAGDQEVKARAIDGSQIRRIDNKLWNKQTKCANTLRDLKLFDNTAILVELKDSAEAEIEKIKQAEEREEMPELVEIDEIINCDDTPNIRTCIVNQENAPQVFEMIQVDIFKTTL